MTTVSWYAGFEEDVFAVASRPVFPGGPNETPLETIAAAQRLLAAFEPPKCGKVLHHTAGVNRETPVRASHMTPSEGWIAGDTISCNLPAGHHQFVGESMLRCLQCAQYASDPIHSPVHGNTDLEDAWR